MTKEPESVNGSPGQAGEHLPQTIVDGVEGMLADFESNDRLYGETARNIVRFVLGQKLVGNRG